MCAQLIDNMLEHDWPQQTLSHQCLHFSFKDDETF